MSLYQELKRRNVFRAGAAYESLDVAFEQHHSGLGNFLFHDTFRYLEADPRYPVFLKKLGLLEIWKALPPE